MNAFKINIYPEILHAGYKYNFIAFVPVILSFVSVILPKMSYFKENSFFYLS